VWLRCRSYAQPTFSLSSTTSGAPTTRLGISWRSAGRMCRGHLTCEGPRWPVHVQEEGQGGQRSLVGFMYAQTPPYPAR
jgi:hypothetical protein